MTTRLITTLLLASCLFGSLCYANTDNNKEHHDTFSVIDMLEDPNDASSVVVILLNHKLSQLDAADYPYSITIKKAFTPDANNTLPEPQAKHLDDLEDTILTPAFSQNCESFIDAGRATYIAKHYREIYYYCANQQNLEAVLSNLAKQHDFTFTVVQNPSEDSLEVLKAVLKQASDRSSTNTTTR